MSYVFKLPNGEFLTGQSWRKENPLFANLPFFTSLVGADNNMAEALGPLLALAKVDGQTTSALMVRENRFFLLF